MRKNFIRLEENFTCENCNTEVVGSGYTDHCPSCLYGKHVDENVPGDRLSKCEGILKPIGLKRTGEKTQIRYICEKCQKESFCKTSEKDNKDILVQLSTNP